MLWWVGGGSVSLGVTMCFDVFGGLSVGWAFCVCGLLVGLGGLLVGLGTTGRFGGLLLGLVGLELSVDLFGGLEI